MNSMINIKTNPVNLFTDRQLSMNTLTHAQEKTYKALLNAGIELIMQKGYDNVNVSDITDYADYGRSTFYLYFKDKEDMARVLLQYQSDQLDAYIIKIAKDLPSPQREWMCWKIMFEVVDKQRDFFLHMDGELSYRLRKLQKDYLIQTFEKNLRSGISNAGVDVPPELGARFLVGTLLEIMEYWLQNPDYGTAEQMATYMYRIVFRKLPEIDANHLPDKPSLSSS